MLFIAHGCPQAVLQVQLFGLIADQHAIFNQKRHKSLTLLEPEQHEIGSGVANQRDTGACCKCLFQGLTVSIQCFYLQCDTGQSFLIQCLRGDLCDWLWYGVGRNNFEQRLNDFC